ncbi:hypothetical protein GCM10022210_56450 [Mucilaginibacter dorajii]|uniref:Oligosaccharide repeat unit polymerase n=2 Tax=Mucilaginibacter dorajii TaxID=692994 RepID=A0ABP7RB24_9SPHI
MIEVKIKYVSLILSDPLLAIVSGGLIADEHLLLYFFLGISGLIGFALIRKEDGFFLNFIGGLFSVLIVVFYFFLGRREVAIMSICFLLLAKGKGISKVKWLLLGVSSLVIVVFIMSLRIGDEGKKIYDLNSEELSPVSYSSYIIQQNELYNPLRGITEATILRPFLFNKSSIAVQYFKNEVGDPAATPVIGIAGITYMYGFIVPFINVFILGVLFRTVSVSFNKSKSPWLKIFLIYLTFKAFNLFRNGEFSILSLDILMFTILMIPALMFKFEKRSAT